MNIQERPERSGGTEAAAGRGPVRFPPPAVYVTGLLLGWGTEAIRPTPDLPGIVALIAFILGLGLFALLDPAATARFKQAETNFIPWKPATALVTDGPYRFTRNPMYLGMAALYCGIALGTGLMWGLVLLPIVLAVIQFAVIRREEAYLEGLFGDTYRDYRAKVRRWI
jgi:protein-S-isoprenylcysteine O-methyltransferase Ste14